MRMVLKKRERTATGAKYESKSGSGHSRWNGEHSKPTCPIVNGLKNSKPAWHWSSCRDLETTGTCANGGRLVKSSSKPIHSRDKKTGNLAALSCNGTQLVWIKTLHGKFVFCLHKYQFHRHSTNYFKLTNQLQQGYVSQGLQELCGYYSNRLSFEEVARLVEQLAGERLLSDPVDWTNCEW